MGMCVPDSTWCNGYLDCPDGSDEIPGCNGSKLSVVQSLQCCRSKREHISCFCSDFLQTPFAFQRIINLRLQYIYIMFYRHRIYLTAGNPCSVVLGLLLGRVLTLSFLDTGL